MRIVLQRVKQARVSVDSCIAGRIGPGVLLLVGVHRDDGPEVADFLAAKCANVRIFDDQDGVMNRSVAEAGGAALVVSQFTLYGDCRKGRRPSYIEAAGPEKGKELFDTFVARLREHLAIVETGRFGANMQVTLVNDGPVTLILDR
jgi:D-tyrosyl-tRNA(Tyr) deacylase